jgi:hypothetical protein
VLEPNIAFHVRKETVCVCPNVTHAMSVSEKSHGFMVAKTVLEAIDSPVRTKVQVSAGCTSTAPLAGIL